MPVTDSMDGRHCGPAFAPPPKATGAEFLNLRWMLEVESWTFRCSARTRPASHVLHRNAIGIHRSEVSRNPCLMRYLALACDYDGTLAHDGRVSASTVSALESLLASGRRL